MNKYFEFVPVCPAYTKKPNLKLLIYYRCYEDDPDASAEMQLEQALDENDLVYHDTMIAANS